MEEGYHPKRQVFYLYGMDQATLLDLSVEHDIDILPEDLSGHLFHLIGDPDEVQRILSAVKQQTGIVRVYPNLELAQAAGNPV
jgi:hypothetical protein